MILKLRHNDLKMKLNIKEWSFVAKLLADDTALFGKSENKLRRLVDVQCV